MMPLGIQWGNNPKVTFGETCSGPNGPCNQEKLTEQWINEQAVKDLATAPLNFDHLGYGGRLAGPVDNAKASCMGCHQTAGYPNRADPAGILGEWIGFETRCRARSLGPTKAFE